MAGGIKQIMGKMKEKKEDEKHIRVYYLGKTDSTLLKTSGIFSCYF